MKYKPRGYKRIVLDDVKIIPLGVLEERPTQATGQGADLKFEEYQTAADGREIMVRYWLNRGDHHEYTHQVVVEARECPNGGWQEVGKLYPFANAL